MKRIFIVFFSFIIPLVVGKLKNQEPTKKKDKSFSIINSATKKPINIIFMLPLFLGPEEMNHNNKKLSDHALSFYLGAKTAIDFILSFQQKQKINIKIFDTKNEKKRIIHFVQSYDLSKTHVIIGPFFRSSLEEVAKNNKKIPIISPFISSDYLNYYPNIIQAEVRDSFLIEPILEEIKMIDKNQKVNTLYLLGEDPFQKITNFVKKKLSNQHFHVFHFEKNFSHIFIKKTPFFVIFLGGNSILGKEFISFIKKFSVKKIIPFGIGFNDIFYQNISLLKEYKFFFTTKYHLDIDDKNKKKMFFFIKKKLGDHLNQYQLLGFDLSYDILYKLIINNNLFQIIDKKSFSGLVRKYRYEKISKIGGYFNKGLWVVRLY
jgi:hypothetical protein